LPGGGQGGDGGGRDRGVADPAQRDRSRSIRRSCPARSGCCPMTQVKDSPPVRADGRGAAARARRQVLSDWVVKRGVLFALVTAPLASLFLGVLRITPPRLGYLYILLASIALPACVAWLTALS